MTTRIQCDVCEGYNGNHYTESLYLKHILPHLPERNWHICNDCSGEMNQIMIAWYEEKRRNILSQKNIRTEIEMI